MGGVVAEKKITAMFGETEVTLATVNGREKWIGSRTYSDGRKEDISISVDKRNVVEPVILLTTTTTTRFGGKPEFRPLQFKLNGNLITDMGYASHSQLLGMELQRNMNRFWGMRK